MISGDVHRYPDIYLTAERNPVKPQLGDNLMKNFTPQTCPLPPQDVESIAQHVREGEGRKEGNNYLGIC